MLTVTDAAGAHLAEIIKHEGFPEDTAIRFVHEGQGLAMRPDTERSGDASYNHEGRTVLLLDAEVAELLSGNTLDMEGSKLTLLRSDEDKPTA